MVDKIFTLREAEELIPKLEPIVRNLMDNRRHVLQIGTQLSRIQEEMKIDGGKTVNPADLVNRQTELEFHVRVIEEGLASIEEFGAEAKDLDMGLVDFPSIINGKPALLCWRYGEKRIDFYHSPEEGFAGRKPLSRDTLPA